MGTGLSLFHYYSEDATVEFYGVCAIALGVTLGEGFKNNAPGKTFTWDACQVASLTRISMKTKAKSHRRMSKIISKASVVLLPIAAHRFKCNQVSF